jgi:UDP-glucuronate decarboxylase
MIDASISFMEAPENITGPMNLGNPNEVSILVLAETIIRLTHSTSTITFKPLPEDDPIQRCPDIRYAEKIIQWQPFTRLEDGLKKTIAFFRDLLKIG